MAPLAEQFVHWSPRVLGLLFAAFVSLFALDVFGEGHTLGETLLALAHHLFPTALILIAVLLGWRWPWAGALGFAALAAAYGLMIAHHFRWGWFAIIGGPALLTAALFAADAFLRTPPAPSP